MTDRGKITDKVTKKEDRGELPKVQQPDGHRVIVYHKNEGLAKRGKRPRPGETVAYRSIKDFDEDENAKFDEVLILCDKPKRKKGNDDG